MRDGSLRDEGGGKRDPPGARSRRWCPFYLRGGANRALEVWPRPGPRALSDELGVLDVEVVDHVDHGQLLRELEDLAGRNKKPNRTGRTEPNSLILEPDAETNRTELDRTMMRSKSAGRTASNRENQISEPNRTDQISEIMEPKLSVGKISVEERAAIQWLGWRRTVMTSIASS